MVKKKKKSPCQCRKCKRCKFNPWVRKTPWSRKWYSTPVFWPGKFHGQRNLVGYSPWGCKEHGGSTEHIINLWKINLEYRMGFIIRKSELKSVFQNLLGIKMRFFKYEKSRTICFIYTIMKHTFKPFLRENIYFLFLKIFWFWPHSIAES